MTASEYTFERESARKLLEICLIVLWHQATVDRYEVARRNAFGELAHSCRPEETLVLVDRSEQSVQTADVVARLNVVVSGGPQVLRTAVVVSSTLHKLQAMRIGDLASLSVFKAREDALAWLFDTNTQHENQHEPKDF